MASIIGLPISGERRPVLEKQIITWSYWLGMLSSLLALALRFLNMIGLLSSSVFYKGNTLWYMSLYKGALLFFLMAIATASYASVHGNKT
jgi:hypothetical protein